MKLPEINLRELEKIKKENFRERLEFQDRYVNWMRKTDNASWSSAQKVMIDRSSVDTVKRSNPNRSVQARHSKRRPKNRH